MAVSARAHGRRGAIVALAATIAIACSSSGTGPDGSSNGGGGNDAPTHPAGLLGARITSVTGQLFAAAITPNGTVIVTDLRDPVAYRFALAAPTAGQLTIPVSVQPADVVVNRAGTTAYVVSGRGAIHVIDVAAGTVRSTIQAGTVPLFRMVLSPDESRLFVVGSGARVWSVPTNGGTPTSVQLTGTLMNVAIAPSGNALYVASINGGMWRLDPGTLATQAQVAVAGPFLGDVVVSPDGAQLYVVQDQGDLFILNATTLATTGFLDVGPGPVGMAMTPDGAQLYIVSSFGQLTIVDRTRLAVVTRLDLGSSPGRIAFDRPGKTAIIPNEYGWIDVIK